MDTEQVGKMYQQVVQEMRGTPRRGDWASQHALLTVEPDREAIRAGTNSATAANDPEQHGPRSEFLPL